MEAIQSSVSPGTVPFIAPSSDRKSCEIRLGIVMYGGVALAIYINGVAYELYRSVRGTGVYRLLKTITDSDVVVDVISGTSAGGINGILLGYALSNEFDFSPVARLWREHGDIAELLRSPSGDPASFTSLLQGDEYYLPHIEDALRKMAETKAPEGDVSRISEMDLFVTGTDVDGACFTDFDDAGNAIDVKDHRAVFWLKHRENRKTPFAVEQLDRDKLSANQRALAKLARITSCFPGAFTPVHVDERYKSEADERLWEWGRLQKSSRFIDGGVLDNKPFSHTLGAIYSKMTDREVKRKLLFVEPDPELFEKREEASDPNFFQVILSSLVGISGYESIFDDLKAITDRNSKIDLLNRLTIALQPECAPSPPGKKGQPFARFLKDPTSRILYQRSRLVFVSNRILDGLVKDRAPRRYMRAEERAKAVALIAQFDEMTADPAALLDSFDVYFPLRRLYRVVYLIYDFLYSDLELDEDRRAKYATIMHLFGRQIKLYEILRFALEHYIDHLPEQWKDAELSVFWPMLGSALSCILHVDEEVEAILPAGFGEGSDPAAWLDPDCLSRVHGVMRRRLEQLAAEKNPSFDDEFSGMLSRAETCELQILESYLDHEDPIWFAYHYFAELDRYLFPMELAAGVHEKDVIETIRISPVDAQRGFSRKSIDEKLAGDSFHHFGGFFKQSWRSNDILWGRLDGLCQLVEMIATHERLHKLSESPEQRRRIRRWIENEGDFSDIFPHTPQPARDDIKEWLLLVFADEISHRRDGLYERMFNERRTLLIEAAQLEILHEEVPNVLEDAIREQTRWNHYRLRKRKSSRKIRAMFDTQSWHFLASEDRIDGVVASAAANQFLKDAVRPLRNGQEAERPDQTHMGRFFKNSYRVGAETLTRDIPTPVLMRILSTALLVLHNCVLGAFGPRAHRLRRNFLYVAFVRAPLSVFHWIAQSRSSRPSRLRNALIGLAAACAILILFGWFGRGLASGVSASWYMYLIVVPTAILLLLLSAATRMILIPYQLVGGGLLLVAAFVAYANLEQIQAWVPDGTAGYVVLSVGLLFQLAFIMAVAYRMLQEGGMLHGSRIKQPRIVEESAPPVPREALPARQDTDAVPV